MRVPNFSPSFQSQSTTRYTGIRIFSSLQNERFRLLDNLIPILRFMTLVAMNSYIILLLYQTPKFLNHICIWTNNDGDHYKAFFRAISDTAYNNCCSCIWTQTTCLLSDQIIYIKKEFVGNLFSRPRHVKRKNYIWSFNCCAGDIAFFSRSNADEI